MWKRLTPFLTKEHFLWVMILKLKHVSRPVRPLEETFCNENETCPGSQEWGCRATVNVGDNKLRLRHLALVASLILSLFYSDFLLHDKFLMPLRCANDL